MVKWEKIVGNALFAFGTSAVAINFIGAGTHEAITAGLLTALFQALIATGAALQDENKTQEQAPSRLNNLVVL